VFGTQYHNDSLHVKRNLRLVSNGTRLQHSEYIIREIQTVVHQKTSEELVRQMRSTGIIAGKTRTLREVAEDPVVQDKKLTSKDTKTESEIVLGSPPLITPYLESEGRRLSFPPRLGEHNEAIYGGELGMSRKRIAQLRAAIWC